MSMQHSSGIPTFQPAQLDALKTLVADAAAEHGFDAVRVTDIDLSAHAKRYQAWLDAGHHGSMAYLAENVDKRLHPELLVEGVCRVIVARMPYLHNGSAPLQVLQDGDRAYISRYALGRDYHKVLRRRLARVADRLNAAVQPFDHRYRAFTDSAPVLEKALAVKSGHGWVGRHSLVLNEEAGSWFFLGEVYTNVPLPVDAADAIDRCGACRACVQVCPTNAIIEGRTIDARRCISYLTIESHEPIPQALRQALGNRVFGCDDCQLYCPWNRTAPAAKEPDFLPRALLAEATLLELFELSEAQFLARTEGTPLRRLNYQQWQRNLAVALGNGAPHAAVIDALRARLQSASPMVAEHIRWALDQLALKNASR